MKNCNENDVLTDIQQFIDKQACGIDGFFTDSKTAAREILNYIQKQSPTEQTAEADMAQIQNLAALFFTPGEIGIMLEMKPEEVRDAMYDDTSFFYRAFYSGRLQSEADLRKSIVKLAKSGSSPAQTMSLDLLNKSKAKMVV